MGCVYVARCKISKKEYVGKTIYSMRLRRKQHKAGAARGSTNLFHRALRKYGYKNFQWKILFVSDDPEKLETEEIRQIRTRETRFPDGYNMTDGGGGFLVGELCSDHKKKISVALKGRKKTPEHVRRVSEALKGRKLSESHVCSLKNAFRPKQTVESNIKRMLSQVGVPKQCGKCGGEGHNKRTCPELTEEERALLPKRKRGRNKGKTYDEIYGPDLAEVMREYRKRPRKRKILFPT